MRNPYGPGGGPRARGAALVSLTPAELALVSEALDSHIYWQLSEPQFRNNGAVEEDGAEDADARRQICAVRRLLDRVGELRQ